MLEALCVIGKGGFLVWNMSEQKELSPEISHALKEMICEDYLPNILSDPIKLIPPRTWVNGTEPLAVEWSADSNFIYAAVHLRALCISWAKEFLLDFARVFCNFWASEITSSLGGSIWRMKLTPGERMREFHSVVEALINFYESGAWRSKRNTSNEHVNKKVSHSKKENRNWDINEKAIPSSSLDYSDNVNASHAQDEEELKKKLFSLIQSSPKDSKEVSQSSTSLTESSSSFLTSLLSKVGITSSQNKQALLQSALVQKLTERNVARSVAELIVDQTVDYLEPESKKITSHSLYEAVRNAISHILTPQSHTSLVGEIRGWKSSHSNQSPYTIVFVGVNGVGKSTNLAKIAYHLMEEGFSILIAACDTFRAGAVEQLRTHVRNLSLLGGKGVKISLHEQGYGKNASEIATAAKNRAKRESFDVLLVDTAGRMQDNEPLMRALGSLVVAIAPQKIFFVGEALVGGEAVDQLAQFNSALNQWASGSRIQGIILSKFDTVDDRVGAAVSMAYTAKAPVVFVGTGQTYVDLKAIDVGQVVSSLLC